MKSCLNCKLTCRRLLGVVWFNLAGLKADMLRPLKKEVVKKCTVAVLMLREVKCEVGSVKSCLSSGSGLDGVIAAWNQNQIVANNSQRVDWTLGWMERSNSSHYSCWIKCTVTCLLSVINIKLSDQLEVTEEPKETDFFKTSFGPSFWSPKLGWWFQDLDWRI